MNLIQTWNLFINPKRKIFINTYNIQNLIPKSGLEKIKPQLINLNEQREKIQNEIISLANISDYCITSCSNTCCDTDESDYYHFKSIDYVLRLFSEKPISKFSQEEKQDAFFVFIYKTIKRMLQKEHPFRHTKNKKCPNLTDTGCEFTGKDRPIICVAWTCQNYRQALPNDILIKIGILTRELSQVSDKVEKLLINL